MEVSCAEGVGTDHGGGEIHITMRWKPNTAEGLRK